MTIKATPLPADALLGRYAGNGAFTDCYAVEVPGQVPFPAYVEAFYTGGLFKLERRLLGWLAGRPSTDDQARALGRGECERFSAWTVEGRMPNQLLMCDMAGRTRSWLMAVPSGSGTRLHFGSAVVPKANAAGQPGGMGWLFHALLGFHAWYSRALLGAAQKRVLRTGTD
jgi:hypothetical protein